MALRVYQGEHKPDLLIEVEDRSHDADFNLVTGWRVIAVRLQGQVVVDDLAPEVVVDGALPYKVRVRHLWTSEETAVAGRLYAEVEATWPDGAKQTFRPRSNAIDVVPSGA